MRAQTDNESSARIAADHAAQRTLQAAHLLQEALTLLRADSTMPVAHTMKRTPDRLLRLPEIERLTGLCRSAIYEQMRRGIFPRSVKAGQRTRDMAGERRAIMDRGSHERAHNVIPIAVVASRAFRLVNSGESELRPSRVSRASKARNVFWWWRRQSPGSPYWRRQRPRPS